MASGLPDEVVVRFKAELAELREGLTEVRNQFKATGDAAEGVGEKGKTMIEVFAGRGGNESRHLRLLAMELGQLEGAGSAASRGMFGLLGAFRALDEGLTTLSGAIGITVAAIGLIVTAFVAWTEHTKKQREEQEKLEEALHKSYEAMGGTVEQLKELSDLGGKIPASLHLTREAIKGLADDELHRKISNLEEAMGKQFAIMKAGGKGAEAAAVEFHRLKIELEFLTNQHITLAQAVELARKAQEKQNAAMKEADRLAQELAKAGFESIAEKIRQEAKDVENLARAWDNFAAARGAALVQMAHNHENFLKQVAKATIKWAEEMAATKAIQLLGTLLFPELGAGMFAAGGVSSQSRQLANLLGLKAMRTGETAQPSGAF